MTLSENFGNKMNYLFKRMNSFLSLKKYIKWLKIKEIPSDQLAEN